MRSNELTAPHPVVAVASSDLAGIGAGERRRWRRARVLDENGATTCYRANGEAGEDLRGAVSVTGTGPGPFGRRKLIGDELSR